jgi:hypothetical protein
MKRFRIFAGLLLGAALIVPVAVRAGVHGRDHDKRYYDRDGHHYHQWNDHEDRAYRIYLGEQHQQYREFRKVKPAHQREYFRWRHEHSGYHAIQR